MASPSGNLDRIVIRDLRVRCIIGTLECERREKQDVSITIALQADLRKAGGSDRIEDTIDYRVLERQVIAMVDESSCRLLEHLAERIAEVCLGDRRVRRVTVSLDKPGAPCSARSVAVELVRDQKGAG